MHSSFENSYDLINDPRLFKAVKLFNSQEWYSAHDAFEELWHETNGIERTTLQGILQVAVAQVHLEKGNLKGATILYGEGLGRLRTVGSFDLGFDIDQFCNCIKDRLKLLQRGISPEFSKNPVLISRHLKL